MSCLMGDSEVRAMQAENKALKAENARLRHLLGNEGWSREEIAAALAAKPEETSRWPRAEDRDGISPDVRRIFEATEPKETPRCTCADRLGPVGNPHLMTCPARKP